MCFESRYPCDRPSSLILTNALLTDAEVFGHLDRICYIWVLRAVIAWFIQSTNQQLSGCTACFWVVSFDFHFYAALEGSAGPENRGKKSLFVALKLLLIRSSFWFLFAFEKFCIPGFRIVVCCHLSVVCLFILSFHEVPWGWLVDSKTKKTVVVLVALLVFVPYSAFRAVHCLFDPPINDHGCAAHYWCRDICASAVTGSGKRRLAIPSLDLRWWWLIVDSRLLLLCLVSHVEKGFHASKKVKQPQYEIQQQQQQRGHACSKLNH